ncbi:Gfo/Idh/MocA family protein [Paracoccus sp. KR1-242]|uniref:Gfo/Idh/MocA family protein n=1 Tax=Paracoccus sp. KR1-242 TaxID=3410028 RepID=UPI003C086E52
MTQTQSLRLGLLGAANIGRQFTAAVAGSDKVTVAAVASRSDDRAAAYAAENGIPRSHGSYEALLADPAIDAVYIPLPNNMHAEWAIRALQAGKHVLCEKPLAMNADEVAGMFDAARSAGRLLVEGYPWLAQPQTARLREMLAAGEIGEVRQISAAFVAPFSDPTNIRLKPENGGGALLDLGSYCVSMLRVVAGTRPVSVTAQADWSDTGVDRGMVATLLFPNGVSATLNCSFSALYQRRALICGSGGSITTTYRNHAPGAEAEPMQMWQGGAMLTEVQTIPSAGVNGFRAEAESFADAVAFGPDRWTGASEAESLDIAMMLDAITASARTGRMVELPQVTA